MSEAIWLEITFKESEVQNAIVAGTEVMKEQPVLKIVGLDNENSFVPLDNLVGWKETRIGLLDSQREVLFNGGTITKDELVFT